MTIEICSTTLEITQAAQKNGAHRVELCSAIEQGGLTPSYGLIQACVKQTDLDVFVMIRHRQGGFVYGVNDIEIMLADIEAASNAGAHGVVFGCLTDNNKIEFEQNKYLMSRAKHLGLGTTFHRAFDFCVDPFQALEQIIDLGFDRILTSGQKATAIEGVVLIDNLVRHARGRIKIMAGSGVRSNNAKKIAEVGVDALHFTAHQKVSESQNLGMGNALKVDEEKIRQIVMSL